MAEDFRIVAYNEQDQLVTLLNLESRGYMWKLANTMTVTPGGRQPAMAVGDSRRIASRQVSERRENGTVSARWGIKGASTDACIARLEALLAQADTATTEVYVLWRVDGSSNIGLYPIRGAATAQALEYHWSALQEGFLIAEVTWPVAPMVEEPVMDMADDFRTRQVDDPLGIVNDVWNSRAEIDNTGWVAGEGTITRGAVTASQFPGANAYFILTSPVTPASTGPTVYGASTIATDYPRNGTCKAGDTIAFAASYRVDAFAGTTLVSIRGGIRFLNASGGTATSVQAAIINTTTAGTITDLAGTAVAPAGAVRYMPYVQPIFAGIPTSYTCSWTKVMTVNLPTGAAVPTFFDEYSENGRAEGALGASRAFRLAESSLVEYTIPGGAIAWRSVAQGALGMPNLASQPLALIVHTKRRPWKHGQVTVMGMAKTGASSVNYSVTPGLGYDPADGRYYWATMESGNMRIYEWDGLANTSRAVAVIASPAAGTPYWMRIRRDSLSVTAEYWATIPTSTGAPTATCTYAWGATVSTLRDRAGYPVLQGYGMAASDATCQNLLQLWEVRPYTYQLQAAPSTVSLSQIPGTAPASADVEVSFSAGDATQPRFLLLGWRRALAGTSATGVKTSLIEGTTWSAKVGGWANVVNARYRGAGALEASLTNADVSMSADYLVDPTIFEADDFFDDASVAVFIRYYRSGTSTAVVSPRWQAGLYDAAGNLLNLTPEFGVTGRFVPTVATGGTGMLGSFLGTLSMPRNRATAVILRITLSWSFGTTAATLMALDEIYLEPVSGLAMMPTDKARDDGTYPTLLTASSAITRVQTGLVTTSDSGVVGLPHPQSLGMGGANIEFTTAKEGVELLVRPSFSVPDDPTTNAADALTHNTTVHVAVTPRHYLLA